MAGPGSGFQIRVGIEPISQGRHGPVGDGFEAVSQENGGAAVGGPSFMPRRFLIDRTGCYIGLAKP